VRKLIIDIGNTLTKAALFEKKELKDVSVHSTFDGNLVTELLKKHKSVDASIISSVKYHDGEALRALHGLDTFIELDENTHVPVKVLYKTPETLGKDRLAAACGAWARYPGKDILIIDAGTAITYEFVSSKGEYRGGGISPGIALRFRALHTFTGKLPLIEHREPLLLTGNDTKTSIISGVINGALAEVDGIIKRYVDDYPGLITLITGGDLGYFDKKLKSNIFALPNLVLEGLNEILDWNTHRK
jgi:type III pantothenate kinase